ncbi:hypothetical protein FXF51_01050 [Nonomuraea sp. PA05]|nr:hypothetical protein FXF51_01050 [Nonomuraea sp. PA05]
MFASRSHQSCDGGATQGRGHQPARCRLPARAPVTDRAGHAAGTAEPAATGPLPRPRRDRAGALELTCQRLADPAQAHSLLVHTGESYEKLRVLSVIGAQTLRWPPGRARPVRARRRR